MSIFDLFKTQQPAQQPVPVAQGQQPTADNPATTDPNPAASSKQEFDDFWNNPEPVENPNQLNFDITPQQLAEIAGKIDYTQIISPEIRQRIAAGGEDAMAATLEAMNLLGRQTYQHNALATTKLIQKAVQATESNLDQRIAKQVKLLGLSEGVTESNPNLENPAFKPIVDLAKTQILAKYPNASKSELNTMLNRYLNKMGEAFNPELSKKANANSAGLQLQDQSKETNWIDYLSD